MSPRKKETARVVGESVYRKLPAGAPELEHKYGSNAHILSPPFLMSVLARACGPETHQPEFGECLRTIYRHLLAAAMDVEFPRVFAQMPTRMAAYHPETAILRSEILDPSVKIVTVAIARAGTVPSETCFEVLHQALPAAGIRQDHFFMNRRTDVEGRVIDIDFAGSKIGGTYDNAVVLIPDPMGATGLSINAAISHIKNVGRPRAIVALHAIITPEYLRSVLEAHPETRVYAVRLDRGCSPPEVYDSVPGARWDRERGLNDRQYIVPGGGGFGELFNNAEK